VITALFLLLIATASLGLSYAKRERLAQRIASVFILTGAGKSLDRFSIAIGYRF